MHFKTHPTRHIYSTTPDDNHRYEPPENDSIIQTASPLQMDQPTTGTTKSTNHNTPWRHNSNTGTTVGTVHTQNNECNDNKKTEADPHASDAESEGHIRFNCNERVFCDLYKTFNHSSRACRKQPDNTPNPTISNGQRRGTSKKQSQPTTRTSQAPQKQLRDCRTSKYQHTKPLVTFNHRYEAIHKVAFGISTRQQDNKTILIEYAKKLPANTRDKLLRKIAKKNSYIKTLDDTFRQAIDINRETFYVEAATG